MIILNGPTGSGKSTTLHQLGELGYRIIPTYSTRPPRESDDNETICIDEEKYLSMLKSGKLLTTSTVYTVHGPWYYGLAKEDFRKNTVKSVVIGNYFFMPAVLQYLATKKNDVAFSVFLRVDHHAILQEKGLDPVRNADLMSRLERDNWKCTELREHADFTLENFGLGLPSYEVTNIVNNAYNQELGRRGVKIK